jgi:hypothetical protein
MIKIFMEGGLNMQVSEKYQKLLNELNIPNLRSNILIADLKTIQYGILNKDNGVTLNYNDYWHKSLSKDMLDLINEWKSKNFSEDLFLILNDNFKQIVENDNTKYSAQMIFPFFIDEKLSGFAIFFRTNGNYIDSSSKAPKTIRNFIQKELNKENNLEGEFMENNKNGNNFDLAWFSKENIDLIDDKIELDICKLLDIDDYLEINRKFNEVTLKLTSSLTSEQLSLLHEYQHLDLEISSYLQALAYYLGLKDNSNKK